ncbi:MAG: hypothetical protein IJ343_10635 [Clostridia bacterium]|nr:hypothetical protein [Clostridia bacterium]
MSDLIDRVSRLKGMAAAMKLNMEEDSSRLLLEMLSLMGQMAEELQNMQDAHSELSEYVESLDDDLADLAESVLDDGGDADDGVLPMDDDEPDEMDDEDMIIYACPHCGKEIEFSPADVDFDEDFLCPECGKAVFPEIDEDD